MKNIEIAKGNYRFVRVHNSSRVHNTTEVVGYAIRDDEDQQAGGIMSCEAAVAELQQRVPGVKPRAEGDI